MSSKIELLIDALRKLGVKNVDEASPELVEKVLKSSSGEMKDAPNNIIGKGKNLEALKKAKENAPSMEAPAYPKNVTQDTLADIPESRTTKDFHMVDDSKLPATIARPDVPKVKPDTPEMGDMADELEQFGDFGLPTGKSMDRAKNLAGGAALVGAGTVPFMMGGEEQQAKPFGVLEAAAVSAAPAIVNNLMNPKPKQPELPRNPAIEKPAAAPQNTEQSDPVEDDYLKQLEAAQAKEKELDFIDNMLRAGTTIGAGIGRTKADYSGVDALQKQNSKGVQNVKAKMDADMDSKKIKKAKMELEDDKAMRDPNSSVSQMFRTAMADAGFKVPEKTSAQDGKNMGANVYNILSQKIAREEARLNRQATMNNANTERTKSSLDRGIQNFKKGKAYESFNSSKSALNSIDDAIATGDKIAAGTAFMRFAKTAQGDDSVVKSEDMKTLLGGKDYTPAAFASRMQDLAVGKNVTDRELKAMQAIAKKLVKNEGTKAYKDLSPHLQKIKSNNLDESEYINPLEAEEIRSYAPVETPAGTVQKETVQFKSQKKPGSIVKAGGKSFIVNADGMTGTEQ